MIIARNVGPATNTDKCIYDTVPDYAGFPDQWFLDEPRTAAGEEIDAREFIEGVRYSGPLPALVPIHTNGREVGFRLAAFQMPIVSTTVAQAISRLAPRDVQCFPVAIPGARGSYQILNAVNSLDCLDEARSVFTRWQPGDHREDLIGEYRTVTTIRISPEKTFDHHVFRIRNWTVALFVSNTIKDALEVMPELGVRFEPAS